MTIPPTCATNVCLSRSHFTGKERDSESGLDNFEARYLGSSLGRFMSPDPTGGHKEDPQTLNKYAYVRNNPLNLTDPTGLDFYLSCGKDSTTCHSGVQGTTTTNTDANGNQTSKFTATQIGDDGKGGLVDKTTNTGAYTGGWATSPPPKYNSTLS